MQPERFVELGIDPPKGVMLYGPPGTGKTLCARAVANRTDATFIRVIGSELVQKYVGEGARMVRELFEMARSKKAAIIFFDEVDAIGGARFDDGAGGDNEVQRTMLELINQLDGFDARGNIKVLMATNRCVFTLHACISVWFLHGCGHFAANLEVLSTHRPDTLDPALLRPGRIDRRVEFGLPDAEGRAHILRIHAYVFASHSSSSSFFGRLSLSPSRPSFPETEVSLFLSLSLFVLCSRSMSTERNIRWDLIARLCPNATGAELRSVCTEAGMFAIRERRKVVSEKDCLAAVEKVRFSRLLFFDALSPRCDLPKPDR